MATKKKKASVGKTVEKKVEKTVKKQAKKRPLLAFIFFLLLGGAVVGGFFGMQAIAKNDVFEIVGKQTITLQVGEEYIEEGAKAVCFGQDMSEDVKIEVDPSFDIDKEGVYYIKYTIDNIRFKEIVRYRYVIVEALSEEVGQ